LVNNKEVK